MNETSEQERQVRRFLLGQMEEHERQQLEQTLMVNTEYREQVLIVEETLIEDYLDGVLPPDEQKAFETYFLASSQQRLRVKIARILGSYASEKASDSDRQQPPTSPPPRRWSISLGIRNHPVVFASLAAVALVIITLAVVRGVRMWRERTERLEATMQRLDLERELVRLNRTPVQGITASTLSLVLAPVTLRDANNTVTLPIPLPVEIVEVRLILSGNIYPSYAVELSRIGASEKFSVDGLHVQSTAGGQVVVIRLPSRMLSRGDYRLSLIGLANDSKRTSAGEYHFHVGS